MNINSNENLTPGINPMALMTEAALAMADLPRTIAKHDESEASRSEIAGLLTTILIGAGLPERVAAEAMDILHPTAAE